MKTETIGSTIDKMYEIRSQKTELNKQLKELTETYEALERSLLDKLDTEETNQGRSKYATATISELVVPTIDDWGSFEDYIIDNRALYMLEKRPAGAIFRELINQGEEVPGLKPFTKRSISLRKL